MTTSELIALTRRTDLEVHVRKMGCQFAFVSFVAIWILLIGGLLGDRLRGLLFAAPLSVVIPLVIYCAAELIATSQTRYLRDLRSELARRINGPTPSEVSAVLGKHDDPGAICCLFSGQGLPHGKAYQGWMFFPSDGDVVFNATSYRGDLFDRDMTRVELTDRYDQSMPVADRDQICNLMLKLKGTPHGQVEAQVIDGFPVRAVLLFGDGTDPTVIWRNLSGLSDDEQQDDRVKLLNAVATIVCERDVNRSVENT